MLALEMAAFWNAGKWINATSVITPVVSGSGIVAPASAQYKSWNVTAVDADTLLSVNHGFVDKNGNPVAPDLTEIQHGASTTTAGRASWGVTTTPTQIILTKQPAVGSGGAPAAKLIAGQPHSVIQ